MGLSNWCRKKFKNWLYPPDENTKEAYDQPTVMSNSGRAGTHVKKFPTGKVAGGLASILRRNRVTKSAANQAMMKADSRERPDFDMQGMSFTMYNATGGTVIEFRGHNRRSEEQVYELHIIPEGGNFTEELAKIITMCRLRLI